MNSVLRYLQGPAKIIVTALLVMAVMAIWNPFGANASTTTAADKIGIAASDMQIMNQNQTANTSTSEYCDLFNAGSNPCGDSANPPSTPGVVTFNTSTTEDLVINLSMECGVYTAVGATGGGSGTKTSSTATGEVVVTLYLDGKPLPTSQNAGPYSNSGDPNANPPTTGNGPVVFCNRAFNLSTANLSLGQMISIYDNTRDANSYTWFATNIGNGSHTLEARANLIANTCAGTTSTTDCTGSGTNIFYQTPAASAIIGQRTFNVEPTHLANSATF